MWNHVNLLMIFTQMQLPDCLHRLLPGLFLLSYSVFVFSFPYFFRFCAVR